MYKTIIILLFLGLWISTITAQQANEVTGTYILDGVENVKSSIQLKSNYTFSFSFSHEGMDRFGTGRWIKEKNTIILTSRLQPARNYKLLSAKKVNDNYVTLKFSDTNPRIIKGIECTLFTSRGKQKLRTGDDGIVRFPKNVVDSIQVFSSFFPDHPFTYIVSNKIQNYFEFAFEKWIAEFFFTDFVLRSSNNMLVGPNPFLRGNQFRYIKEAL